MGRRGPTPKRYTNESTKHVTVRISEKTLADIDAAARRTGKTRTYEIERRLINSFGTFDEETHGLALMISDAFRRAGEQTFLAMHPRSADLDDWIVDPSAYDAAVSAAAFVFE